MFLCFLPRNSSRTTRTPKLFYVIGSSNICKDFFSQKGKTPAKKKDKPPKMFRFCSLLSSVVWLLKSLGTWRRIRKTGRTTRFENTDRLTYFILQLTHTQIARYSNSKSVSYARKEKKRSPLETATPAYTYTSVSTVTPARIPVSLDFLRSQQF